MSTDLRTLAQAYLDAREVDATSGDLAASRDVTRTGLALGAALGTPNTVPPAAHAAATLTALDAADAQGYARAMGEVVEHASQQSDECHETRWDPCVMGRQDAWDDCYEWARERLPAAAERD